MPFPLCAKPQKPCVDSIQESNDCLVSCSGLYADVRKSEAKVLDNDGWAKIKQSYVKYLGIDLPSISSSFFNPDNTGKIW